MLRLHIIAIVAALALIGISFYLRQEWFAVLAPVSVYSNETFIVSFDDMLGQLARITLTGSLAGLGFQVFFIVYFIRSMQRLSTFITRMISLISAALTVIVFLITLIGVIIPGDVHFPGISILLISFAVLMLPACIVNLIQAKKAAAGQAA